MNIKGYAFKENESEIRGKYRERYEEIKHHMGTLEMKITPAYGKGEFSGVLKTDAEKALTPLDIALIADGGSLCFGGHCVIRGDRFNGAYWTD